MDVRNIVDAAKLQNWTVTPGKGDGHLRFFDAAGNYVGEMPSTASSATSIRNNLARLKRGGLEFPVDKKRAKALRKRGISPA